MDHATDHVVSPRVYLLVFAALLGLTWLTVQVAAIDLGQPELLGLRVPLNVFVALAIAVTKGTLVVLFFMHVRWAPRLVWLVLGSSFVWLGILIVITISDYWSRGWLGNPGT
jgi:cytochrome c oxidase subunit 4